MGNPAFSSRPIVVLEAHDAATFTVTPWRAPTGIWRRLGPVATFDESYAAQVRCMEQIMRYDGAYLTTLSTIPFLGRAQ